MNTAWQDFMESQGASFDDKGRARFGTPGADCALMDLSWLGLIRVGGGDAASFLQGQVTSDTREIDATHSALSAYCTPKGRMLALFRLFQRNDALFLLLPAERLEATLKRLSLFVLMADAKLEDASDELARIAIAGECAAAMLKTYVGEPPTENNGAVTHGDITLLRSDSDRPRFIIIAPTHEMAALWAKLAENASPVDSDFWRLLDIRAAIPSVYDETAEAFVPQMANLQLIDGVSFTKGCYTGQEVVARMQYLGKLKRRMYPGHIDTDTVPEPGTPLYSEKSQSGQGSGKIVDAVAGDRGGVEALVIAEIAAVEQGPLHVGDESGPVIELGEPPYAFAIND